MPYSAKHDSAQRQQAMVRSVALLQVLRRRVEACSVYAFAEQFDALAAPETPTQGQGKNGWQALFNGSRPLSADRLRALASVPVWADAQDLYKCGPSNLWLAMWGSLKALRGMFEQELTQWRTFDQLLAEFEGDLLVAEAQGESLALSHLARSVALHRLYRAMSDLAPLELDGKGAARCLRQCLDNSSVQLELDAMAVLPFIDQELRALLAAEGGSARTPHAADQRWDMIAPRLAWVG
ncbi:hypothetical protein [Paracidovorax wautersii]|uniref:Uncharacterized protein n=1 Tax=Paracidovorax wautersii TaxID=1177982 RepID=A0A1I2GJ41_9BURK|nr:hypothetical protein [Paracidovorax wautersii]SFF17605.1 hypothetical protein SAMN04489711_11587 [Paracidovorax wautersii]